MPTYFIKLLFITIYTFYFITGAHSQVPSLLDDLNQQLTIIKKINLRGDIILMNLGSKSDIEVLFENETVKLTKPLVLTEKVTRKTPVKKLLSTTLFERLRQLRQQIALEESIPVYLVFNDATLKEIENERPLSEEEFLSISGVGQRKLDVYGTAFINEVKAFIDSKKNTKKKI